MEFYSSIQSTNIRKKYINLTKHMDFFFPFSGSALIGQESDGDSLVSLVAFFFWAFVGAPTGSPNI